MYVCELLCCVIKIWFDWKLNKSSAVSGIENKTTPIMVYLYVYLE